MVRSTSKTFAAGSTPTVLALINSILIVSDPTECIPSTRVVAFDHINSGNQLNSCEFFYDKS